MIVAFFLVQVLDENSNCSIIYRDSCTADSIVTMAGLGKTHLMKAIADQAWRRQTRARNHTKTGTSMHGLVFFASGF
jgi:hypothetical protein